MLSPNTQLINFNHGQSVAAAALDRKPASALIRAAAVESLQASHTHNMLRPVAAAAAAVGASSSAILGGAADEEAACSCGPDAASTGQDGSTEELGDVDFAMVLSDVSSFRSSKAKRFLRSMWLFGPSQVRDVEVAIEQLRSALEREGFHTTRARDHGEVGSSCEILLLIRATDARLRREHYREQLEAWVQARTGVSGAGGEFEPQEIDEPRQYFSSARRIALLQPPLDHLLPQLEKSVLRGGDLLALQRCYPLHDRRFATQLLVHLARHAFLQAQMLHQLRNEYGEKVAFYFGFRTFHQRWLRMPALLGALLTVAGHLTPEKSALPAYLTPVFGLSISLWGAAMLEAWRLQQNELAALWGVEHLREAEVIRPEFRGERTMYRTAGTRTHTAAALP